MIQKEKKTQVILENATHEGDTGSPEVQVAILTARINELTDHLRTLEFFAFYTDISTAYAVYTHYIAFSGVAIVCVYI